MSEETLSQVALNAKAFSRDEDDEESALHSNWGSDESDTECHGDGRPRDSPDELPVQPQALDEHQGLLLPQSGAQAPDFSRVPTFQNARRVCRYVRQIHQFH